MMKTTPPLFETIKLGLNDETACTPKLGGWDYRGIKLNAPMKVIINDEFVLPLCGAWKFSEKFLNTFNDFINTQIVIVVTDLNTHQSFSGNLRKPGLKSPEYSKRDGSDEELEENTVASWFNIDVYNYVRSLPQKPGKYQIYALVGEVKSNVVDIEIDVEKGSTPGSRKPRPLF
ncbi:MAG: hypothetical protein OEY89_08180 [Gammaproteobacteria bacterium]|nr:hypothetical protein [Gammaproteobacteria bacterium]